MTQSNEATTYFDLHTTGIGYLNRIREVTPKKGSSFLACSVAALHGKSDDVEYTYIDCRVSGADASKLVRRCKAAVDANKKVLISFRIGDIWLDQFVYEKGERKGQTGYGLKGRLLYISMIKVDGQLVYQAKPLTAEGEGNTQPLQTDSTDEAA